MNVASMFALMAAGLVVSAGGGGASDILFETVKTSTIAAADGDGVNSLSVDAIYNGNAAEENKVDPYCPLFSDTDAEEEGRLRRTLNVHVVPHTHDDVGWLKTVDQYYYGLNNTIQKANVSSILDSVLLSLSQNPHRTFTYVETKFFSKWYATLPPSSKSLLKGLIDSKRFSFANGGWCMHDEANSHFMGMIDQTTLGHAFLKKELGVVPRVGWQIDPFGHSATQASLMTAGVGFDALYFGRIHHRDLERRREDAECEGLWSPSTMDGYGGGGSVFWGLTGSYGGNYGGPQGFCFDEYCGNDYRPLVGLSDELLFQRMQNFTRLVAVQANQTKGRNLMLTMGMDFFYSQAGQNFENLDILVEAANRFLSSGSIEVGDFFGERFDDVKVFYSTPERYTGCKYVDAVNAKRNNEKSAAGSHAVVQTVDDKYNPATWTSSRKTGDFFPYADCDHCYWSGYFSSRQSLKRMERVGSSFLHMARQVESMIRLQTLNEAKENNLDAVERAQNVTASGFSGAKTTQLDSERSWNSSPLYTLDDAMGIAQHHDAVTGTSKQHVAYDYAKRIAEGMSDAGIFVADGLRQMLFGPESGVLENLSHCYLLNETICDVSQEASQDDDAIIYVIVHNALAQTRSETVPLPVDLDSRYIVEQLQEDMVWATIDSSLIVNEQMLHSQASAEFVLYFEARDMPPLGASIFRITKELNKKPLPRNADENPDHFRHDSAFEEEDFVVSNGVLSVQFDRSTGVIKSISEQGENGISIGIDHEYGYYESFVSVEGNGAQHSAKNFHTGPLLKSGVADPAGTLQNGGAYIFRPTLDQSFHTIPPKVASDSGGVVVQGSDLVTEVYSHFGAVEGPAWIRQITRLIKGKDYIEVEYIVGPVPIDDGIGKEVVSRYSTNIESNGVFYTDSNGREFMERKRGDPMVFGRDTPEFEPDLEPVSGNYYPVNTAAYIEDEHKSFSVLVDRSQGGSHSSLTDGSLELMIQRRLLYDDARGVGEALNETDIGITACPPYGNATRLGTGVVIKGTHRLMIGKKGASSARSQMDGVFSQPQVFVASVQKDVEIAFHQPGLSMLKKALPENIMVVSFVAMEEDGTFLVRLAHQYADHESKVHSHPAFVDLQDLFPSRDIVSIKEKTLSANQDKSDWERRRLRWNEHAGEEATVGDGQAISDVKTSVVLQPLEIRTFEILVSYKHEQRSHDENSDQEVNTALIIAWVIAGALNVGVICFCLRGAMKDIWGAICQRAWGSLGESHDEAGSTGFSLAGSEPLLDLDMAE